MENRIKPDSTQQENGTVQLTVAQAQAQLEHLRQLEIEECRRQVTVLLDKYRCRVVCIHVGGNAPTYDVISQ
jgi:hypothetical protein